MDEGEKEEALQQASALKVGLAHNKMFSTHGFPSRNLLARPLLRASPGTSSEENFGDGFHFRNTERFGWLGPVLGDAMALPQGRF